MAHPDETPADRLADLLTRELRTAISARLAGGADPAHLADSLDRRIRALRGCTTTWTQPS